MDEVMPEVDGFDAMAQIRNPASKVMNHRVPVIAHAMKGDREKCLEAGMDDYISKPVKPQELWMWLKKGSFGRPVRGWPFQSVIIFFRIRQALVPPNPNELDMPYVILCFRA